MATQGMLYVISAPSGGGKTSLVNALLENDKQLRFSVSHTTRAARPTEKEGSHYFFVNKQAFEVMVEQQAFLEYAEVFGHYYGTSRQWVNDTLAKGLDVILEIDWQGAESVRQSGIECVSVFILPPHLAALERRLVARQQDNADVIAERLRQSKEEISHYPEFDYLVVNDDFNVALADIQAIVRAERCALAYQRIHNSDLLAKLLE